MANADFVNIYDVLFSHYGPQEWWPAESPFEMIVGAVLTQNTSWTNVEKALDNLKRSGLLSFGALRELNVDELALLIRPAGYYNLKAKRLSNLLQMIADRYEGELQYLLDDDFFTCRERLLEVKGVGEETADSILLYACGHPVFVVDTYTHRVFSRHNLVEEQSCYGDIQQCFMDNLPADSQLFNEYHALIVRVAKEFCKKTKPKCEMCPLKGI